MTLTLSSSLLAAAAGPNPLNGSIVTPGAFQPGAGTGAGAAGYPIEIFLSMMLGLLTTIGGLLFLVYFITGGLNWMSSNGDKGKIESARHQLVAAAVGLIVVVLSQAIVGIAGGVLGLDILNPVNMLTNLIK